MKRMLLVGLSIAAAGACLSGCATSANDAEHSGSTRQKWDTDTTWPINSDCSCPDPSTISWEDQDECAFAQQFLEVLYQQGVTWNGGTSFQQEPAPGNSGACSDSVLPPLTWYGPWGTDGDLLLTPVFQPNDNNGLYNALNYYGSGLMWRNMPNSGPYGGTFNFMDQPVMFGLFNYTYNWGTYENQQYDFEPTKCPGCFVKDF